MRKIVFLFLYLLWSFSGSGQFSSGFDPNEARDMAAICNSFTYIDLYGSDLEILPEGYQKVYTSPVVGMDNRFQVYIKGNVAVINFRGSTDQKSSWLANMYSALIPSKGEITIQDKTFPYQFGVDTASSVHSGYALALAYLHDPLVEQLKQIHKRGIRHVYLTGHSQGGALAVLVRAYLHYSKEIPRGLQFKVYTFAQPMSGNFAFANEYNHQFCKPEMSYSLVNPEDIVPKMPYSYNDSTFIRDHLVALLSKDERFDAQKMLREGLMYLFNEKFSRTVEKFGVSVAEQLEKELGAIQLPEPTGKINFSQVGNQIELPPPYYPLALKDSSVLQDSVFMASHPRDEQGLFLDKSVYKKTSISQHHKPYNYYTAVLRKYFPEMYERTEPKSFGL